MANGYGREDYYQSGDIHLKPAGLKALLSYLRTHAYQTDDRRPDTANIPKRAEYTANPSSAVAAPSSSEAASSSEGQSVLYQAAYRVDKNGGGTLVQRQRQRQDGTDLRCDQHSSVCQRDCHVPQGWCCVRPLERRRHPEDPHRHQFQAECGCDRHVCTGIHQHQQHRQGGFGRLLHLYRKAGR